MCDRMKITMLVLLVLALVCDSARAINLGLGKHKKNDYPWKNEWACQHPNDAPLKAAYPPKGMFFLTLGPTGIKARINPDAPSHLLVTFVFQDTESPAKGKVEKGDVIVGAGGKLFTRKHVFGRKGNRKGWDGPLMELSYAIEDAQGADGKLELTVLKGGSKRSSKTVELQLKPVGRFAKSYPWDCPRSEAMLAELCEFMVAEIEAGRAGRPHSRTHMYLALMASGIKKYESFAEKRVKRFKGKKYNPASGGFVCWNWGFDGILIGEYYRRHKDKGFLSTIESLRDCYVKGSHGGRGTYSHKSALHLKKSGKKGYASIGGISGLAMTAMSLFRAQDLPYPEELHDLLHKRYLGHAKDDKMNLAYNLGGIEEPPSVVVKLQDPSKAASDDGSRKKVVGGMKDMGAYEIVYPAPLGGGHNWIYGQCKKRAKAAGKKVFWWVEEEKSKNIVVQRAAGEKNRKILRNVPPEFSPEPEGPFKTTGESMHNFCIGTGAAAHMVGALGRKPWEWIGKHCANTCANSYEHVFSGHGGGQLHGFWAVVATAWADEKNQRAFLDYLKSFLILSQTHTGEMIVQPWNRDRPGGNGDPFYGSRSLPTATAAMLLSYPKKRLMIMGAEGAVTTAASSSSFGSASNAEYVPPWRRQQPKEPEPLRDARSISDTQRDILDRALLRTLATLSEEGMLLPKPLKISLTSAGIWLKSATQKGDLTFELVSGTQEASIGFDDLSPKDQATLALLVVELKPESTDAKAMAAVYLELLGLVQRADELFVKAGDSSRKKLESLFE